MKQFRIEQANFTAMVTAHRVPWWLARRADIRAVLALEVGERYVDADGDNWERIE